MSRYSQDKMKELDSQIARLMAIYPNISGRRIAEILSLHPNFANKRKNKISRANAEAIKNLTVEQDLGDIRNFLNSTLPEIAKIIFDNGEKDEKGQWIKTPASSRDKINAMRVLFAGKTALLDKKFDAGIFERQIGKLKTENDITPENQALIKQALEYAFNPDHPTKYLGGDITQPDNKKKDSE